MNVTVLMPAYNAGQYIAEAIRSVLGQTYKDFELLIVDDGSTDDTAQIVASFGDPRIRLVKQANGGVSSALNTGLAHASAELVARFDADDICMPDRLEQQVTFMQNNPDHILIGADADYVTEQGEYIYTHRNIAYDDAEIRMRVMDGCPFIHSTVCYRKSKVLEAGGYEVKAHTFEDYFLWVKLIGLGKVRNFEKPNIRVRFNPASVTIDEKDYSPEFKRLKRKALETGVITDEEGRRIKESITKLDAQRKLASYHRMLGKKFLWNNYQPGKARKHIISSLRMEPFSLTSYALLVMSLLPKGLIRNIYNRVKEK